MENIIVHLDINAQLVIPEWLRAKMGLTKDIEDDDDAENEPCDCCDDESEDNDDDTEAKAEDEAVSKLLHALGYRFVYIDGNHLACSK